MKTAGTGMKLAGESIVIIDAAVSFGGDIMESKSTQEAFGKCAIDLVTTGLSVTASVAFTPAVGAVVGIGLGLLADGLKSWLW